MAAAGENYFDGTLVSLEGQGTPREFNLITKKRISRRCSKFEE
jgi:hypothetical protein